MRWQMNQGWEVEGIEFPETASEVASSLGYKVHRGPLETAPEPEQKYDLVVAWMVLEHLTLSNFRIEKTP